jgi:hypothetical protein
MTNTKWTEKILLEMHKSILEIHGLLLEKEIRRKAKAVAVEKERIRISAFKNKNGRLDKNRQNRL